MLNVATLNVAGLPPRPPLLPLAERAAELCRRLNDAPIDVLNLQEVWFHSSLRQLRAGLCAYPHVAFRPGLYGPAGALVTFARRPLGHPTYHSFAGIVPDRGPLAFRLRRGAEGWAKGFLATTIEGITIVNTHLSANVDDDYSPQGRLFGFQRSQLLRLNRALARLAGPVVLCGDFNIPSSSPLYPLITNHGVRRDPFADADLPTYHSAFLRPGVAAERVDYLLVDGDRPVLAAAPLLAEAVDGHYLSDHVGLTVEIG